MVPRRHRRQEQVKQQFQGLGWSSPNWLQQPRRAERSPESCPTAAPEEKALVPVPFSPVPVSLVRVSPVPMTLPESSE